MENNEPLVKGGCGHSDRATLESAKYCAFCVLGAVALVALGLIFG